MKKIIQVGTHYTLYIYCMKAVTSVTATESFFFNFYFIISGFSWHEEFACVEYTVHDGHLLLPFQCVFQ